VVSEEIRVNVLNQPYQSFEWIDLCERFYQLEQIHTTAMAIWPKCNAATVADVRNFFKTTTAPSNAVLTIAG